MKKYFIIIFCLVFLLPWAYSQKNSKIPLTYSVYDSWKSVTNEIINDDGNWVSYEIN